MNRNSLVTLALCFLAGCGDTHSKTFHLSIHRDPSSNESRRQTKVAFHPPAKAEIIVEADGDRSSIVFDSKDPNGERESIVLLVAERRSNAADGRSLVETLIRPETPNGAFAGGRSTYTVDADQALNEVLDVTVADGEFPLNEPVRLGTYQGTHTFIDTVPFARKR